VALIPSAVQLRCEDILAAPLLSIESISGGDINQARLLKTENQSCFLKMNTLPQSLQMFETEAKGLQLILQSKAIDTPEIIHFGTADGTAFLLLSYVSLATKTDVFWQNFGRSLALLHRDNSHSHFGLDHANFIGSLDQANDFETSWTAFYVNQRIEPQLKTAINSGCLNKTHTKAFHRLFNQLDELLPQEVPALTHGDLWSGNFLVGQNQKAVLIDPAVSFAHREMDLAMSHLFGGFSQIFYDVYQATYPLENGFHDRMDIYQLYYLMVHVNLFGGSYVEAVNQILEKYR